MRVNADVHEHAILLVHRRLSDDYNTFNKATIDFREDTVCYERRRLTKRGFFDMYHNVEY